MCTITQLSYISLAYFSSIFFSMFILILLSQNSFRLLPTSNTTSLFIFYRQSLETWILLFSSDSSKLASVIFLFVL